MLKLLPIILLLFAFLFIAPVSASADSYVSVVNPIRGQDFWQEKNQKPIDGVKGELNILKKYNLEATWLVRPDVFSDSGIISLLKTLPASHERGLFLEITPSWTKKTGIKYKESGNWHSAGSVFLTGYSVEDRKKLIDFAFEEFKKNFKIYPKSVGAWYIDSNSLGYMKEKYGVNSALIVADQYSTDNYQIWGQYFGYPYYPDKSNTLIPAQPTHLEY